MKVLITIGHTHILLPDDAGLPTIMKALARGVECQDMRYSCSQKIMLREPVSVKTEYITGQVKFEKDERYEQMCRDAREQVRRDQASAKTIEIGEGHPVLRLGAGGGR